LLFKWKTEKPVLFKSASVHPNEDHVNFVTKL